MLLERIEEAICYDKPEWLEILNLSEE